jgi:hypothetical protein
MAKVGAFWSRSPKEFIGVVNAKVYELTRKRAIDIYEYAVEYSPVESGAYRASWTINEGEPKFFFVGRQPRFQAELDAPPTPIGLSTKFYRKFFVANGAPYALRLENGWSDQAPRGVLRQAIKSTAP